ncbi:uncharacterized protein GGS25DRAFT_36226 [Hypoxylon fragiforme]|uniref:uncharacterized protein n=1 Tax=Hypoxylon fragiforme TaxID=63214 RepID=UPI0020C6ACFE|nr:uncharacterized protein GGS25DRAFT_36226 [Hypoxylon fragiforme]KAI2614147.1 hypothetical protein GGS25DRAFT_36226 [Hypoxylon fragiforme]
MASLNPLQLFIFPFLFCVALPLALCAGLTTIMAFMVLFLRLFLVYFDVGLETLRYVLLGHATQARYMASRQTPSDSQSASQEPSPPSSPEARNHRRRMRPGSISSGTVTPANGLDGLALTSSIGLERDFEGVGGWRLDRIGADADSPENDQWYNLNSRLEILDRRHHVRSQSGGAVPSTSSGLGIYAKGANAPTTRSPEGIKLHPSPNSSRSRTPTNSRPQSFLKVDGDDHFPLLDGRHIKKSRH